MAIKSAKEVWSKYGDKNAFEKAMQGVIAMIERAMNFVQRDIYNKNLLKFDVEKIIINI